MIIEKGDRKQIENETQKRATHTVRVIPVCTVKAEKTPKRNKFRKMPVAEMSNRQYRSMCWNMGRKYKKRRKIVQTESSAKILNENESVLVEKYMYNGICVKIFEKSPLRFLKTNSERMRKILQNVNGILDTPDAKTIYSVFWEKCGYQKKDMRQYSSPETREKLWAAIYRDESSQMQCFA